MVFDAIGSVVIGFSGVVILHEMVGHIPLPDNVAPHAGSVVGFDLDEPVGPEFAVLRRPQRGGVASHGNRLSSGEPVPSNRHNIAIGQHDGIVVELKLVVGQLVRPFNVAVPIKNFQSTGCAGCTIFPLGGRELRAAEKITIFEQVVGGSRVGARPRVDTMARIIDELDSPAGRGRNDGIAVKRQGGVIQKQAHCLGHRQPIFQGLKIPGLAPAASR